jgi:tRNA pseudouridine65 synthase
MNQVSILFQNADFLAVDKPVGISVHNNEDPQNLLLLLKNQLQLTQLYPVHRLDKETSGVQVLALNEDAARMLAEEFHKRTIQKLYLGVLRGGWKQDEGIWNQALTDKAEGRQNPAGMAKFRVRCETRYKTLKTSEFFTLCEFDLITGRQHQIRKHAAIAHHSLVGDSRYGDTKYNKKIANFYQTQRMFLHCSTLEIAGQRLKSPTPEEFEAVFS